MTEVNENPEPSEDFETSEKPEDTSQTEQEVKAEELETNKDARNMAMLCHLLAIFSSFIAPLIIWLLKKDEEPFVDSQGKEALNFQITVILAMVVSSLLTAICIGVPLLFAIPIANLVFCIIAAVKASNGVAYRYPVSIRFLK